MGLEKQVRDFFNISKDIDHIDLEWHKKKFQGEAEDIDDSTISMVTQIIPRLPLHFIRGALVGGALGYAASHFTKTDQTRLYSLIAGTLDWTQYGVRAVYMWAKSR